MNFFTDERNPSFCWEPSGLTLYSSCSSWARWSWTTCRLRRRAWRRRSGGSDTGRSWGPKGSSLRSRLAPSLVDCRGKRHRRHQSVERGRKKRKSFRWVCGDKTKNEHRLPRVVFTSYLFRVMLYRLVKVGKHRFVFHRRCGFKRCKSNIWVDFLGGVIARLMHSKIEQGPDSNNPLC